MDGGGVETGYAIAALYLVGSAFGTLVVVGGGLYLAYRRSLRREVHHLLDSIPIEGTGRAGGRERSGLRGEGGRP